VVVIHDGTGDIRSLEERCATVMKDLAVCGYLPASARASDPSYSVASAAEWTRRYTAWVQNPVIEDMSRHRSLFDLRPFHGARAVWQSVRDRVDAAVERDIIRVLAHDCLASLPPLTFYQDAVVEQSGEQIAVFRLEHNVLGPLVDLGRVLGMAGRDVMGTSTAERFAMARRLLPAHEAI